MSQHAIDITMIAPILRILLMRDGYYPIVRWLEPAKVKDAEHLDMVLPAQADMDNTIRAMADALKATEHDISYIRVKDMGVFEVACGVMCLFDPG